MELGEGERVAGVVGEGVDDGFADLREEEPPAGVEEVVAECEELAVGGVWVRGRGGRGGGVDEGDAGAGGGRVEAGDAVEVVSSAEEVELDVR